LSLKNKKKTSETISSTEFLAENFFRRISEENSEGDRETKEKEMRSRVDLLLLFLSFSFLKHDSHSCFHLKSKREFEIQVRRTRSFQEKTDSFPGGSSDF